MPQGPPHRRGPSDTTLNVTLQLAKGMGSCILRSPGPRQAGCWRSQGFRNYNPPSPPPSNTLHSTTASSTNKRHNKVRHLAGGTPVTPLNDWLARWLIQVHPTEQTKQNKHFHPSKTNENDNRTKKKQRVPSASWRCRHRSWQCPSVEHRTEMRNRNLLSFGGAR